jgi:chemotaxis protein methyltransferase CheR
MSLPQTTAASGDIAIPLEFELFRKRAYEITGIDLTSYKAPQMYRRLSALLPRLRVGTFTEYARLLQTNPQRRQEFRDFVTINVSEFFRDADRFADLEQRVLPSLLHGAARVRVWSAGCSIGAEAYSIAMLLREQAPGRNHTILATDIDQTILERARQAAGYTAADVRNVGSVRGAHWLSAAADGTFSVNPAARALVRFDKHDLLTQPFPHGPFDLISCRNVVIYFTDQAKQRIYSGFVAALGPHGVLFVGGTEAILRPHDLGLKLIAPGFYRKQEMA